ncbi:sigma-70 family RNA polymerase sigma factor [Falsibacillus albus]|uniref:Sigma-70 family RNA polymerase sigma factor n=1 Tax=Falsibacillus albus TaxID=2478915 RepID=A0A3L7K3M2_9BACI|nr:sigma-70 family RNA polymerase sigma factor [Falsibacillus albus]RLQ97430.1 sigma-70 family RNA polymerase sigma factor [Falsibacillus albus]
MKEKKYKALVKKAIKGNNKAFEVLIKHHYQQIYRTAFIYTRNEGDALDVVQEATCQALIQIKSLRTPEFFMTWFTRIIIRCAAKLIDKRKDIVPICEEMIESYHNVSQQAGKEESMVLLEAISTLKDSYKTAIILFYYHDYSIKTISKMMDIPEGTVKTHLSRGKSELKKILSREEFCYGS